MKVALADIEPFVVDTEHLQDLKRVMAEQGLLVPISLRKGTPPYKTYSYAKVAVARDLGWTEVEAVFY